MEEQRGKEEQQPFWERHESEKLAGKGLLSEEGKEGTTYERAGTASFFW